MTRVQRTPPVGNKASTRSGSRSGSRSTRERWVTTDSTEASKADSDQQAAPTDGAASHSGAPTRTTSSELQAPQSPKTPGTVLAEVLGDVPLFTPQPTGIRSLPSSRGSGHSINRKPTPAQLSSKLKALDERVSDFDANFTVIPNWESCLAKTSNSLHLELDAIQMMCTSDTERLSECYALRDRIKIASDRYTERIKGDQASGKGTAAPPDLTTTNEQPAPDQPPACSSASSTVEGRDPNTNPVSNEEFWKLKEGFETKTREIKDVIAAYEEHLLPPDDYDDQCNKVSSLQSEVDSYRSVIDDLTKRVKTLETQMTASTLSCKQYEVIAKGVASENVNLKSQVSSVQDRMDNCEDQILNITRGPSRLSATSMPKESSVNGVTRINPPPVIDLVPESPQRRQDPLPEEANASSMQSPSSSVVSTEFLVHDEDLSRAGRRLKREAMRLRSMLQPAVSSDIPRSTLQDIYKTTVVLIDKERTKLSSDLAAYEKSPDCSDTLCDGIEAILDSAATWTLGMRTKHRELGYHKESLSKKLYENLSPFSSKSEINVFEFFRQFELLTGEAGSPAEQAELLYSKYLDQRTKLELIKKKEDFAGMKTYLIKKYGTLSVITDNILRSLSKETVPTSNASYSTLADYFRRLNSVIQRIAELRKQGNISTDDLEAHIYSQEFLSKLLKYVPSVAKNDFMEKFLDDEDDICTIKGSEAFNTITTCILKNFKKFDSLLRSEDSQDKPARPERSAPKKATPGSPVKSKLSTHTVGGSPKKRSAKPAKKQPSKSKEGPPRFTCFIPTHTHRLGECQELFALSSSERYSAVLNADRFICKTCLGSGFNCDSANCRNSRRIPPALICEGCIDIGKKLNKSPFNVLICKMQAHTRPAVKDFTEALSKFYKGFSPVNQAAPVNLSSHVNLVASSQIHSSKKPKTRSSKTDHSKPVPAINTMTGKEVKVPDDRVIQEANEDIVYVLQFLNLKGHDVLTFYDRGSNQNMVSGPLAEKLGLKVVNEEPAAIGVVGGGRIWTEYGAYALRLGPTDTGHYHELTAQGIREVTDTFPRYDLHKINAEVLASGQLQEGTLLPEFIGGTPAKLLIGLKDTELEPWCVFQLPNGLGVYKSVLKDKFGSNYCYGGPDKLFTTINRQTGGQVNHFRVYLTQIVNQYKGSPYPMLSHALYPDYEDLDNGIVQFKSSMPTYMIRSGDKGAVYPTPVTSRDFEELGTTVQDEIELDNPDVPGEECNCQNGIYPTSHKARIPLSKQREYLDDADKDSLVNYRCPDCLRCKCATSNTKRMMSLQESHEQTIIENSVTVDTNQRKVLVSLPFIKPPVEFLKKRHHGKTDNFSQALSVYKSQCRKPEKDKEGMRLVHKDLVEQGFLKKLQDLTPEQQEIINSNGFKHYMPWRTVSKLSSSTPIRAVVDPSMSGLNLALAKGFNDLAKINDILIRSRCSRKIWTTDIKKLYNQLHLRDESLPYGLFLFDKSMSVDKDPEVFVMMRAWYGVSSTANQSGFALNELTELQKNEYPLAYEILTNNRYVDDVIGGSNTDQEVDQQIAQVQSTLATGGFQTKYVVKSGEKPDEAASSDGTSIKILGYNWTTVDDVLYPGFTELNFNKRTRGVKKPHPFPVVNPEDVNTILSEKHVTRRMVISKLAEFWDPIGLWEPYKLQLKLDAHLLNGLQWDMPLERHLEDHWKARFQEFLLLPDMSAMRCVIPPEAVNPDKIRLVCLSDAAVGAGGCAIYATYLLKDGSYSCTLLTSKSKLMGQSVPRNELEGIRIAANLAYDIKQALGSLIEDVLFFTDSTIAMSWIHNTKKRLRLFCLNRVAETRRLMELATNIDNGVPLYHIDGNLNIADLLTKTHKILPTDLGMNSDWQNGLPWMKLPLADMPITRYEDLTISQEDLVNIEQECFSEVPKPIGPQINSTHVVHCISCTATPTRITLEQCHGSESPDGHCLHCECKTTVSSFALSARKGSFPLVDLIRLGWLKALRVLSIIIKFVWFLRHRRHISNGLQTDPTCRLCEALQSTGSNRIEVEKIIDSEAKATIFRYESKKIRESLPPKKIKQFFCKDGILYKPSRLIEECPVKFKDLDTNIFFDNTEIKTLLPVVMSNSEAFFALVIYIHTKVKKHSGVELTLRETFKTCYAIGNPRRIIQAIRNDCSRCRIIAAKTLELEMAAHPQPRTEIAPVFYNSMMDTVFGFKGKPHKNARTRTKIYALVVVCLLTGATSIMAMEGLETQDVILALERHSARHGVPATIYVDQGTQLMSLDKVNFTLRDIHTQLKDSIGMNVIPSTAKSHEERGRVERKIRSIREMLEKTAGKSDLVMTAIEWETQFSKLASDLDDLPMATGDKADTDLGWQIITANRLKLGRNNSRSLEGPMYLTSKVGPDKMLKRLQDLQAFWYQMMLDRLHHLIPRPLKWSKTDPVKVNDICIFVYNDNPALKGDVWKLGRISEISKNGRKLTVSFPTYRSNDQPAQFKSLIRSPRDVCLLFNSGDVDLNSVEYHRKLNNMESDQSSS